MAGKCWYHFRVCILIDFVNSFHTCTCICLDVLDLSGCLLNCNIQVIPQPWVIKYCVFCVQYENQVNILGTWTNKGPTLSRPKFSDIEGKVSLVDMLRFSSNSPLLELSVYACVCMHVCVSVRAGLDSESRWIESEFWSNWLFRNFYFNAGGDRNSDSIQQCFGLELNFDVSQMKLEFCFYPANFWMRL